MIRKSHLLSRPYIKLCLSLVIFLMAFSKCLSQDFIVRDFSADIEINPEGWFDVTEYYSIEFLRERHGIYRVIQTDYDFEDFDGQTQKRRIRISSIEIPGQKFEVPSKLSQKYSDELRIRIGDPDEYVFGMVDYEISYRVENAFIFDDDSVKFYWNIKNDGWPTDFEKIEFNIELPNRIAATRENSFVYSGARNVTTLTEDFDLIYDYDRLSGRSRTGYVSVPDHNLTVLITMPKGSVAEIKPAFPFFSDYGWTFIITALIGGFYALWRRYGKDEGLPSMTGYYPPKDMDPAMAGYLINDRYDSNDLISLIPYWGTQGLLRIEETKKGSWFPTKDTLIIKLKELPANATDYERKIFNELFSGDYSNEELGFDTVQVSSLKNKFYATMTSAGSQLKKDSRKFYDKKSIRVRNFTYLGLILGGVLMTILAVFIWNILAAVLISVTCLVLCILNFFMIRKNRLGAQLQSELTGFKRFIKVAEENKLKMLLREDDGYFESTMAYALAFGMFAKWAKKFDNLNVPPPTWYSSSSGVTHSSMSDFSKSFSSSISSVTSNMVSSPSSSGSSGGGSSGGGFGGGGGGSW